MAERLFQPTTPAEVRPRYRLAGGELILDLSKVDFGPGAAARRGQRGRGAGPGGAARRGRGRASAAGSGSAPSTCSATSTAAPRSTPSVTEPAVQGPGQGHRPHRQARPDGRLRRDRGPPGQRPPLLPWRRPVRRHPHPPAPAPTTTAPMTPASHDPRHHDPPPLARPDLADLRVRLHRPRPAVPRRPCRPGPPPPLGLAPPAARPRRRHPLRPVPRPRPPRPRSPVPRPRPPTWPSNRWTTRGRPGPVSSPDGPGPTTTGWRPTTSRAGSCRRRGWNPGGRRSGPGCR